MQAEPDTAPLCHSGGAAGADLAWGEAAAAAGHRVVHWSFAGHRTHAPAEAVVVLSAARLREADPHLARAAAALGRPLPPATEYAHNLLRRNWWQVRDSDAVYAVAALDPRGQVEGGSAWAIQMLLDRRPEASAFLFDQRRGRWLAWRRATGRWEPVAAVPRPAGRWTGIGTRAPNSAGAAAIRAMLAPEPGRRAGSDA